VVAAHNTSVCLVVFARSAVRTFYVDHVQMAKLQKPVSLIEECGMRSGGKAGATSVRLP
jgi:hypothetical protein